MMECRAKLRPKGGRQIERDPTASELFDQRRESGRAAEAAAPAPVCQEFALPKVEFMDWRVVESMLVSLFIPPAP